MELLKKYIAPVFVALFVVALFVLLKTSPAYRLWKGYTVLSVPSDVDARVVDNVLMESGCGEVISLETQRNDDDSFFSELFLMEFNERYNQGKSLYFFDKDKRARLYYIPDAYKVHAQRAVSVLNQEYGVGALLAGTGKFPLAAPFVTLAVFLFFFFISKNKIVFFAGGVFPVVFCFCNPFFAISSAAGFEFYALYLAQKVWRRRGSNEFLIRNFCIWIFSVAAILSACSAGLICGILFSMNFFVAVSMLYLVLNLQERYETRFHFVPVLLRNAKMVGRMNLNSVKAMLVCSCAAFVLLILFLTGANFSVANPDKDLYFPAPAEYNGKPTAFASLDDFFAKKWNAVSLQYRSINGENAGIVYPMEGDTVRRTRYSKNGGEIVASEQVVCVYDEAFRKDALDSIKNADYPAIEKLWIEQGEKFSTEYTVGKRVGESGHAVVPILLLAMFLPFGMALYYIFVWRNKRKCFPNMY